MIGHSFQPFIQLPNEWIEKKGLHVFNWKVGRARHTAALMVLMAIAHRTNDEGIAKVTYKEFEAVLPMRRAKISEGIKVLVQLGIILHKPLGQSTFQLVDFGAEGKTWAKLPAKGLYVNGVIWGLKDFRLRRAAELHALKIYFLLASRRNTQTNETRLSYKKIEEWCGVPIGHIKTATSLLIENRLISVDSATDWEKQDPKHSHPNAYRIAHVDSYRHKGTQPVGEGVQPE